MLREASGLDDVEMVSRRKQKNACKDGGPCDSAQIAISNLKLAVSLTEPQKLHLHSASSRSHTSVMTTDQSPTILVKLLTVMLVAQC